MTCVPRGDYEPVHIDGDLHASSVNICYGSQNVCDVLFYLLQFYWVLSTPLYCVEGSLACPGHASFIFSIQLRSIQMPLFYTFFESSVHSGLLLQTPGKITREKP